MTMIAAIPTMITMLCVPFMLHANTLPDPTRPYGYASPRMEVIEVTEPRDGITWNLTGIRISDRDRSAILNGRVVRAGDRIDDARILGIEPDAVLLDHRDEQLRVRLLDVDIKQRKDILSAKQTETAREETNEK